MVTVVTGLLFLTLMFSLFVLPFLLARRGWSSLAIGYTVAAIGTIIPTLFDWRAAAMDDVLIFRGPTIAALTLGILLNGAVLSAVIAVVRKIWSMVTG